MTRISRTTNAAIGFGAALLLSAGSAHAQTVSISIENVQDEGGFAFTPFWVAVHNGGFDSYDGGATAAGFPGLEEIAELGQTGPISAAFAASAAGGAGGVDGVVTSPNTTPPVFAGGDTGSLTLNVGDATVNRYFSYASMLVPTNDLFAGNGNPTGIELFDAAGNFTGPVTIEIFGRDINDAGTEVNDADLGPAFTVGADGTAGAVEDNPVAGIFDDPSAPAYLASIVGNETPLGTITQSFGPDDLLARITIVPAPGAAGLLALGGLVTLRRRR